jgi:hypothetical protein
MMMKGLFIAAVAMLLVACKTEETMTVDYYLANPDARKQKLVQCANNPGDEAIQANCVNAKEAQHKSLFDPDNTGMPSIK